MSMSAADILEKAADLIEPEGAWTRFVFARDASGRRVSEQDPSATCWCAAGAITVTAGGGFFGEGAWKARSALLEALGAGIIPNWNDAPDRTQAEVVAKLREAAEKAREQGL